MTDRGLLCPGKYYQYYRIYETSTGEKIIMKSFDATSAIRYPHFSPLITWFGLSLKFYIVHFATKQKRD